METLIRDIKFAVKLLLRERTFSATVLLTLAICIGANVAMFSVINTVLLEPLAFHEPDRLVTVYNSYPGAGAIRGSNGTVDFFQRRENIAAFQEVALYQGSGSTVGDETGAERLSSMRVTPSFFSLLGVQAALGRTFTEDEMEEGNHLKVVLGDGYWREAFGADPGVVGREMRVDGQSRQIVGVLPADFSVPGSSDARFFLPVAFSDEDRQISSWHSNNFSLMARLAPGATIEQARIQNEALNQALIDQWPMPTARQLLEDVGYHTVVVPAKDDLVRDFRPLLFMLWGGVAMVLLIGCVNIANLMLARAQTRVGEVATRLALGAPRASVARQVLTEALVMAVVGGALGVGLGAVGLRFLLKLGAADLPRGTDIGIDGPVLLFTLALAMGAGVLFGSIPVVQIMRGDLSAVFRMEGRSGTASRRAVLVRNGLVTSQVGLAFVLLMGAGLMLMSFRQALSVDPGFESEGVMTGVVSLPAARYPDADSRIQFYDEMMREVRAIPGVVAASVNAQLPFSGNNSNSVITPEGYLPAPGESLLSPHTNYVGPAYFETMGIELVEGRGFQESDDRSSSNVIVLDEWLANRYWPDRSPLGARMVYGVAPGVDSVPDDALFTVIGVVRNVKQNDLTALESEHFGAYYFSYRQRPPGGLAMVVRTATEPAAITSALRNVIQRMDTELPFYGAQTMEARISESLTDRRIPLVLLGVFAGVALFLSVVGIYGALAYSVTQRRREIGIRMAMGSAPDDVFKSIVGQGMRVTALGLGVGGAAVLLLTRLLQTLLFNVQATDLRVMGAVALVLGVVGLVACILPAQRATKVDPVTVLGR